ncbi:MAG: ribbon-helix-helix protein, CopG family [Stellaceae bacterium]
MNERTTVRLPEELLRRAKHKALAEGRTLTALIEEGLRRVVAEPKPEQTARSLPRISKAKGGLMPGIDLAAPSALQDSEDLAELGRMKHFA